MIEVPVFTISSQVFEKWKTGPLMAQSKINTIAAKNTGVPPL
jgi:hypothetical protein